MSNSRDADGKAERTTHEGHNAVKCWESDRDGQENQDRHDADRNLCYAPEIAGHAHYSRGLGEGLLVYTQ